jgi:hypothetical protein
MTVGDEIWQLIVFYLLLRNTVQSTSHARQPPTHTPRTMPILDCISTPTSLNVLRPAPSSPSHSKMAQL